MSHGSSPRLSCPTPVLNKSSAHGDFPSGNRAVDEQTEGYLQTASGIGSVVSMLLSTARMGWKGLRIQGVFLTSHAEEATARLHSQGMAGASLGASTALGVTQHGGCWIWGTDTPSQLREGEKPPKMCLSWV